MDVTVKPSVLSPAVIFHGSQKKKIQQLKKEGYKGGKAMGWPVPLKVQWCLSLCTIRNTFNSNTFNVHSGFLIYDITSSSFRVFLSLLPGTWRSFRWPWTPGGVDNYIPAGFYYFCQLWFKTKRCHWFSGFSNWIFRCNWTFICCKLMASF